MLTKQEKKWLGLWLGLFFVSTIMVTHFLHTGTRTVGATAAAAATTAVLFLSGFMVRRIMKGDGI